MTKHKTLVNLRPQLTTRSTKNDELLTTYFSQTMTANGDTTEEKQKNPCIKP